MKIVQLNVIEAIIVNTLYFKILDLTMLRRYMTQIYLISPKVYLVYALKFGSEGNALVYYEKARVTNNSLVPFLTIHQLPRVIKPSEKK
jgi:hypothetical protein